MIRNITVEEIPLCAGLIRESFATVAEEFGFTPENAPRFTAFATTAERLTWQMTKEGRIMRVFAENGQIAGYYSLHCLQEDIWELNNLCVHPAFRHRKIGKTLLEDCLDMARNAGGAAVRIGIVEENQKLRRWYESFGFVHTGTQKFEFFPFTCGYMEIQL